MNLIAFPIAALTRGPNVSNLQEALIAALERGALLAAEADRRDELVQSLARERAEQVYGDATAKLVSLFQRERNMLRPTGEVDQPTASALNALLSQWGLLEGERPAGGVVSGAVTFADRRPAADVLVRAQHMAGGAAVRLGEDRTDGEGRYTIRYDGLPGVETIRLRVTAMGGEGKSPWAAGPERSARGLEMVDIQLPAQPEAGARKLTFGGVVATAQGAAAENVKLKLVRRDFGGQPAEVATATSGALGAFAFEYDAAKARGVLEVTAMAAGEDVDLSGPLTGLAEAAPAGLQLRLPAGAVAAEAEYARLTADLKPLLQQNVGRLAEAREGAQQRDISALATATGWDARVVALASKAQRLSQDTGLKPELAYAMLRSGLPSNRAALAEVRPEAVAMALKKARDAGIVSAADASDAAIKGAQDAFAKFARQQRLAAPLPGSSATLADMVSAAPVAEDVRARFTEALLDTTPGLGLWERAAKRDIGEGDIATLKLQGQLAFLAGHSMPVTQRLAALDVKAPADLVARKYHLPQTWTDEVFELAEVPQEARGALDDAQRKAVAALLPASFAQGSVEDRLAAYSSTRARKMRQSYPTHVMAYELEHNDRFTLKEAKTETVKLLQDAAGLGFRLGETPVASFIGRHGAQLGNPASTSFQTATGQLKALQRMYQITPSDEALAVLMALDITSAYDVMAFTPEAFDELFRRKYREVHRVPAPVNMALEVRHRAGQVTSVTYNLFAIAKKMGSEPAVAGLSPPPLQQQELRDSLIKHYPTLESLFGSMDYCECEHCRSVLSPAAYLVDLLQFVDTEAGVWGNFLAQWKVRHGGQDYPHQVNGAIAKPYDVLVERRPDLPHIPLTCENTHTVLPYIDLVNEILEYQVAHGALAPEAARDTGSAASAELLAEPQNVLPAAYGTLRSERYPLALPFDVWAESARRYAGHFDVSFAQLLEVFRRDETLFDAALPHDRAAVFLEQLQMSPVEVELFAAPAPLDAGKWQELYGFEANAANVPATLASAKTLSRRLGLTYREMLQIVHTAFVNPQLPALALLDKLDLRVEDARFFAAHRALLGQAENTLDAAQRQRLPELRAIRARLQAVADRFAVQRSTLEQTIVAMPFGRVLLLQDPDAGCDFERTMLQYADGSAADAAVFLRINLFVRLWRKLGWTMEETDRALTTFIPSGAPYDAAHFAQKPLLSALVGIAHLKTLIEQLQLGPRGRMELPCLWTPIAITGPRPLYAQLFLHSGVLAASPVFDHPLGNYLSDPAVELRAHLPALQGALGLTAAEVELVLAGTGLTLEASLSVANVSLLYRHALLARALKLSVRELLVLRQLSGLDPFATLSAQPPATLADDVAFTQTLEFVQLAQDVRDSGFSVDELDFLLRHRHDAAGPLAPDAAALRGIVRALLQGIRAIHAEHAVPADPAALSDEALRAKLGLVLAADVADTFMAMLAGTATFATGQTTAREYFDLHLLQSPAEGVPATGFLAAADFALLFDPAPAGETEAQAKARVRQQRTRLAQTFLPYLQQRLVRQFLAQTLAATTGADAVLVESLAGDAALLADPQTVLQRLLDAAAPGVTQASPAADARQVDGWLEVPTTGTWRFNVVLEKQGASAVLRLPHLPNPVVVQGNAGADGTVLGAQAQEVVSLKAGELYRFSLSAQGLGGGSVRLLVQGPQMTMGPIARLALYPAAADGAMVAVLRLQKGLALLGKLGFNEREARWLLTHATQFGNPRLGDLPVAQTGDSAPETAAGRQRFAWWRRLARYARLQRQMAGGTDALIGVFEAQALPAADRLQQAVVPRLAEITRREPPVVVAAAEALVRIGAPVSFDSDVPLARLWDALQLLQRLGVTPAAAVAWCGIVRAASDTQRETIARDVRAAIQARFDVEGWRRVAQAINDPLRQRRRDALVACLLHRLGYERIEQLYEHFLIDPGMEPVVQTSRIRLAIGSVQLFIQRCLLNMEAKVQPSTLVAAQWDWMKRYRVWEANRKIFLFPENWLEPEFRDDKTHLFKELEGTLLQEDANADMVEDAFLAYLRKLEELARLDVVAMHVQDHFDPSRRVLHVIARTFGQPHKYFHRRMAHRAWSAWEPVDLPIEGNHLAPVYWRDRLCLFWVTFTEKAVENAAPSGTDAGSTIGSLNVGAAIAVLNSLAANKIVEAQLHWSERVQGEWSARESGGAGFVISKSVAASFRSDSIPVHVSVGYDTDGTELGVTVHLGGDIGEAFHLPGRNALPERGLYSAAAALPYSGGGGTGRLPTRTGGLGALRVAYNRQIVTTNGAAPQMIPDTPDILGQGGFFTLLGPNNDLTLGTSPENFAGALDPQKVAAAVQSGLAEVKSLMKPIFYQDNRHTFFVEPDVTELTVDEVDEWTVSTPTSNPDWERPKWWEEHIVVPVIPKPKWPIGGGDPYPERDWLINPGTVLEFDNGLLGRDGQVGLVLETKVDVVRGMQGGQAVVEVNAASNLGHGVQVLVQDERVLKASPMVVGRGGLNVVGASGFNPGMVGGRFGMGFGG